MQPATSFYPVATQIRAGVIRPEIIIPKDAGKHRGSRPRTSAPQWEGGIRRGDQARIIRDPLFGKIGKS